MGLSISFTSRDIITSLDGAKWVVTADLDNDG
jgi:hypothetical protein